MPLYDLNGKNKYYTLYCCIRGDILRGKLKSGERLPAKRALAKDLGVSVVTVQLAYEQLLAEGYVTSRERSGYFVERVLPQENFLVQREERGAHKKPPEPETEPESGHGRSQPYADDHTQYIADFVKGATPAKLFPFSVWTKLTRAVLADCGEHLLERVPCDGDAELKAEIAAYLYRSRGVDTDPRYIVIGAGAEYLYGVIVQLVGRDKLYAVENPGYATISGAYALNGARFAPVPVGEEGISLGGLKQINADVLHISPSHQFPTGVITPAYMRSRIIEWALGGDRYIVEDDYDSEFRLSGRPLQSLFSLCPERVIYMNTFSKTLAPSMRMGYMALPPALYKKFLKLFSSSANVVPLFEQKTLAAMLKGGYFERHLSRLKNYYRDIRRQTLETLGTLFPDCEVYDTQGGPHLLARLADGYGKDIFDAAKDSGARVKRLSDYFLAPSAEPKKYAVFNYSGVTAEQLAALKFKKYNK